MGAIGVIVVLFCRLVDLKNLSAQTIEAMMQWVPPAGLEVEASIV
jgi:ribosomal protein S10